MDISWGPVIIAALAAGTSVWAAVVAGKRAREAQHSAEMLDSRAHKIARIDAQVEELRDAYKYFLETYATGGLKLTGVAAEFLGSSQGATPELREECRSISRRWGAGDAEPTIRGFAQISHQLYGIKTLDGVGDEYRAAKLSLADERESLMKNKA